MKKIIFVALLKELAKMATVVFAIGITVGMAAWLLTTRHTHKITATVIQQPWECRPYPGYCDIDTDWRDPNGNPSWYIGDGNANPHVPRPE